MTDNENTYPDDELMEAYIQGTLGADERYNLEQRMATDPNVAEKIALHRKVVQLVQAARRQRLQTQFLEHFDKREKVATVLPTGFVGVPKRMAALVGGAAALAFLLLYGALLFRFGEESGKKWAKKHPIVVRDTVFVQNAPPAEMPKIHSAPLDTIKMRQRQIAAMLRPPPRHHPLIRGHAANAALDSLEHTWRQGLYSQTAALAEAYLRDSSDKRTLELYADAAFKIGNYALAEVAYAQLEKYDTWQEAKWNLLLCYAMQLPARKPQFDTLAQEINKWKKPNDFEKELPKLKKLVQ